MFGTDFNLNALSGCRTVVVGIPLDHNSSFLRGSSQAPARIRELLQDGSMNFCAENGLDLGKNQLWMDIGDLVIKSPEVAFPNIGGSLNALVKNGLSVLSLGGDHSITYPIMVGFAAHYPLLTILHLDAHPDLYDEYEGNRYSHACPFARIMEEGLAARLIQVGIRTMVPHQREQVERFGVEVIEMRDWQAGFDLHLQGPLYLSLDMDVFDPGFAPGVSHHEPGGMTPREVLKIIQGIEAPLVGADIVEFNPERDPSGITGRLAAKLYKEILAQMLKQ